MPKTLNNKYYKLGLIIAKILKLISHDILETMHNIRVAYLDFQSLIRKILENWMEMLRENKIETVLHRYNVKTNFYMQQL